MSGVDPGYASELLRRLIAVPSVTGSEDAVSKLLAAELARIGLERIRVEAFAPGRSNVVAELPGRRSDRTILLAAHSDTVSPGEWVETWGDDPRADPFGGIVAEGSIYGRGAADDKGGIAAIIAAVKALVEEGRPNEAGVLIAFVGDEESGEPESGYSAGMDQVIGLIARGELPRPDFAIYAEPTSLDVYVAQMGFVLAEVTVEGETAYFGRPWLGRDAIKGAHGVLSSLWKHSERLEASRSHELVGAPFLLVTEIRGGGLIAVPGSCRIGLIRKVVPGEQMDDVRAELESVAAAAAQKSGLDASVTFTTHRDHPIGGSPAETPRDLPEVQALARLVRRHGRATPVQAAPYWSEMTLLAGIGVPAVYLGPGDVTFCHTPREHVPIDELVSAAEVYRAFILGS